MLMPVRTLSGNQGMYEVDVNVSAAHIVQGLTHCTLFTASYIVTFLVIFCLKPSFLKHEAS